MAMQSGDYYDPAELVDYLARAKQEGFTPSFTNRPDVAEEEGDKAFGVGIRRTPQGKWESFSAKADKKALVNDPTAALMAERPSTGTALGDSVAAASLKRVELENRQSQFVSQQMAPLDENVERLGQAASSISSMLINSSNPKVAEKWAGRQAQYAEEYNAAVAIQQSTLSSLQRLPEYQQMEAEKNQAKEYEAFYGPLAAKEKQMQDQRSQELRLREDTTLAERTESAAAVSDNYANATMGVLGVRDQTIAKDRYANSKIDNTARTVIDAIAENQEAPDLNTPLANIALPTDALYWFGQNYLNQSFQNDPNGRAAGRSLMRVMETQKKENERRMFDAVAENDSVKLYAEEMMGYTSATDKKSPAYQLAAKNKANAQKAAAQAYFQDNVMGPLKQNLLTGNQDLLDRTTAVLGPADLPIAEPIIAGMKASTATTWSDAVAELNNTIIPDLLAKGYSKEQIRIVQGRVFDTYMEEVNSRHELSGVVLTPSDIRSTPGMFSGILDTLRNDYGMPW